MGRIGGTVRFGSSGISSLSVMECERLEYLNHVAWEARRTGKLWEALYAGLASCACGRYLDAKAVGLLVDAWTFGNRSKRR